MSITVDYNCFGLRGLVSLDEGILSSGYWESFCVVQLFACFLTGTADTRTEFLHFQYIVVALKRRGCVFGCKFEVYRDIF